MITSEVLEVVNDFVKNKKSFISLDVYCKLGTRVDDEENPIYEQVREAYRRGHMPNYLSEWHKFNLEEGGRAEVWRYYYPEANASKIESLKPTSEGRLELTKLVSGMMVLDTTELGVHVNDGNITIEPCTGEEQAIVYSGSRVRLPFSMLKEANLNNKDELWAKITPVKIEITESLNE